MPYLVQVIRVLLASDDVRCDEDIARDASIPISKEKRVHAPRS
jgi:hypothetical protein